MRILSRRTLLTLSLAAGAAACAGGDGGEGAGAGSDLSGAIQVDGSSTVYPITEAVAEEFGTETGGNVRVTVGVSGTGGGFKRFCSGETDISNASRPIKDSERELCKQNGIEPIEIPVAYDGIAVVANPANAFLECLTTEELKKVWQPNSSVRTWADVRSGWPANPIKLYGPGTDSGTFDYFTEEITGKAGAHRSDYTPSENDNVLVQGVQGEQNSLGYFGFAYYEENQQRLKLIAVDAGSGCVTPSTEAIKNGTYTPLSRPIFIYTKQQAMQRPEVAAFVRFYLENAPELVGEVGYVPLEDARYQEGMQKLPQADAAQ